MRLACRVVFTSHFVWARRPSCHIRVTESALEPGSASRSGHVGEGHVENPSELAGIPVSVIAYLLNHHGTFTD
jgi:hypothetical protein